MDSHIGIYPKSRQTLELGLLPRILAQMLAFAALISKGTSLAPRAVSAHT